MPKTSTSTSVGKVTKTTTVTTTGAHFSGAKLVQNVRSFMKSTKNA